MLVSVASLWEIVVKVRIGKLTADIGAITGAIERDGFRQLDIRTAHLSALGSLPTHPDHRDPFDHLLIAQAITEDATFISQDQHVGLYPVQSLTCSGPPILPPQ